MDETIQLKLDEVNDLVFGVTIQGAKNSNSVFRIVCEGKEGMELMFQGSPTSDGNVMFSIPPLQEILEPGINNLHLEVVVDNKLFVPMHLMAEFDHGTKVVAESVQVINHTQDATSPVASARLVRVGDTTKNETKDTRASTKPRQAAPKVQNQSTRQAEQKKELTLRELYDMRRSKQKDIKNRLKEADRKVK